MATTIVTKKGSGAPAASDLVEGELAVDTTNGRLYTENSSAAVVELGSNPSGNITFADNGKAIFGAGSDLQIYHDGSNSYIDDAGTGNLRVRANSFEVTNADYTQSYIQAVNTGSVSLFHNGSTKLATTSTGIDVTGTVTSGDITIAVDDTPTLNFKKASSADILGTINVTTDAGSGGKMVFQTKRNGDTALDRMTIDDDGDVGIGATPIAPLHVKGTTNGNLLVRAGSLAVNTLTGTALSSVNDAASATVPLTFEGSEFNFVQSNAVKVKVDSSGKILIGDSASHTSDLLQIETPASGGGHGIQIRRNDSNTDQSVGSITFGNNTATDLASISAKTDGATDSGALLFNTSVSGGANTERMRIDDGGNVGIGVTNMGSAGLSILNSMNFNVSEGANSSFVNIFRQASSAATVVANGYRYSDTANKMESSYASSWAKSAMALNYGKVIFYTDSATTTAVGTDVTPTERMRIDESGKLLVGGTTAATKVTLNKTGFLGASTLGSATDSTFTIDVRGNLSTDIINGEFLGGYLLDAYDSSGASGAGVSKFNGMHFVAGANFGSSASAVDLGFATGSNGNATERMRINSSGNVGIGTKSPSNLLALKSGTNTDMEFGSESGGGFIQTYNRTSSAYGYLRFITSSSETMRLDTSSNVLVGTTTTPSLAGLAVGSTTTGKSISVFSSSNGSNGIIGVYQSNGTQEGQLYAGTGDINLFGTSVVKVVAGTNGVKLNTNATSWVSNSDERAKDIIEPITNAAQKVSTLRAVIGKYKTDSEETRRSFLIAQDVQAVLPEAVDATDEDNLGVRYTETIPLLVAAIKEQQATIESLTARIAALES